MRDHLSAETSRKHAPPNQANCPVVVLLGNLSTETSPLDVAVREFGWSFECTSSLADLREMSAARNVLAVLFEPLAFGNSCHEALRSVLEAAPKAHPILCHRFSETMLWPELAEAGAFHSLLLPLNIGEVRQSLGFLWAAKQHRSGKGARLHGPAPARRRGNRIRLKHAEKEVQTGM